jgi:16S rRNA (adenine1518-N6/adenine1519-N6)-dimethyltransferase
MIEIPPSIKPRRSLGQNFLMDERVLEREVECVHITADDVVLEIGAGTGKLTQRLAQRAKRLIAIEYDRQFTDSLLILTRAHANIEFLWGDALVLELPAFDKLAANLPYHIALPILLRLLSYPFVEGVVVIQKDMAQRICAQPGQVGYGRLAVVAQRLAHAEIVATVPREAFMPLPHVDSAMLRIRPIKKPFAIASDDLFKCLLDHVFLYREDTLTTALYHLPSARPVIPLLPKKLRLKQITRITPDEFGEVSRFLDSHKVRLPITSNAIKRKAQKKF